MGGLYASIRPYSQKLQERVFAFVEAEGYRLVQGGILERHTPDDKAAEWANALKLDLLILPFRLHRDIDGAAVDGMGVAERLSDLFVARCVPILMPVSPYSYSASFFGRLSELELARPDIARLVVPMCENEIGAPEIVEHIHAVRGHSKFPPKTRRSLGPTTGRAPGSGVARIPDLDRMPASGARWHSPGSSRGPADSARRPDSTHHPNSTRRPDSSRVDEARSSGVRSGRRGVPLLDLDEIVARYEEKMRGSDKG